MMRNEELTYERLREVLHYDPKTGIFRWKIYKSSRARAGSVAGCKNGRGYIVIKIDNKIYLAHRLAWLYTEGYLPEHGVDHRDRNPSNNKWDNLREVSQQCNLRNRCTFSNNSSGVKGVCWDRQRNKWKAYIYVDWKRIHLGRYENFDDAVRARYNKEKELNWAGCDSSSPAYLFLKEQEDL